MKIAYNNFAENAITIAKFAIYFAFIIGYDSHIKRGSILLRRKTGGTENGEST